MRRKSASSFERRTVQCVTKDAQTLIGVLDHAYADCVVLVGAHYVNSGQNLGTLVIPMDNVSFFTLVQAETVSSGG